MLNSLNSLWRLWATSWVKSEGVQKWVETHLPKEIRACKGQAVHAVAASVLEQFQEKGLLLSLDWSKCYDTMSPLRIAQLMSEVGLPVGLADACADLWSHQVHWVCWGGSVHPDKLHTCVRVSQGDPFGPLVTAIMATCALNVVRRRLPEHVRDDAEVSVFVDDRSVVASKPETLVASKREWFRWSAQVGLLENESKVAICAATRATRKAAEDVGLGEHLKPCVRLLGACTASKCRGLVQEEVDRLARAYRTLRLIAFVALPFRKYRQVVASHAMPNASFWWLARVPTQQEAWQLWAQVWRRDGVCRLANRFTRAIVLGGCSHLELLAVKHLLSAVMSLASRAIDRWSGDRGHPVFALRGALRKLGWTTPVPWVFTHHSGYRIDLRNRRLQQAKAVHILREGWRADLWKRFLEWNRHEVSDWDALPNWQQEFKRLDLESIRKWAFSGPAPRSVALLSVASPAWQVPGSSDRCLGLRGLRILAPHYVGLLLSLNPLPLSYRALVGTSIRVGGEEYKLLLFRSGLLRLLRKTGAAGTRKVPC